MGKSSMLHQILFLFLAVLITLVEAPAQAQSDDDDTIHKCRIIEILRPGQRESNRYIIRGYSRKGRKIDVFKLSLIHI